MLWRVLADCVVAAHLAFVAFVVLGGLLTLRWRGAAWAHVPAALWGAAIEVGGWVCPLTPLEVRFRRMGGEAVYAGGFVDRYLLPLLYPGSLTRGTQVALGAAVLLLNAALYAWIWRRARRPAERAG